MTLLRLEGRGCVNSGSIDVGHHTRFEIIDRRHDLQLPGPGEIGEERAPQPQVPGRPSSALLGRIVYEVPRLALNGDGRWQDWVDHPANHSGKNYAGSTREQASKTNQ